MELVLELLLMTQIDGQIFFFQIFSSHTASVWRHSVPPDETKPTSYKAAYVVKRKLGEI